MHRPRLSPLRAARGLSRRALLAAALAPLLAGSALPALAQPAWPAARPITIVLAYPPGGDTDAILRVYADKLAEKIGQQFVIDNRPGASGVIGSAYAAKAAPDGYTLLFTPSTFPIAQHVMKVSPAVAHDVVKDFTPIIKTGNIPLLLITSPDTGIRNVAQLVAQAKGGKAFTYATPGTGSPMHLMGELFNQDAGMRIEHVPYKGVGPVVTDVLGNHVPMGWITPGAAAGYIAAGKLVPLAVADRQRSPLLPNVPTLVELGYKNAAIGAWMGLLGPKGLPPQIVATLNRAMNEVLQMPDVQARMQALGIDPVGGTPAVLAAQVADDDTRLGQLVKDFNIHAE